MSENTIHRVVVPIDHTTDKVLPGYVRALHVEPARVLTGYDPTYHFELWYEVNDQLPQDRTVRIHVVGTGHPIDFTGRHIASFTSPNGGNLVWHVWVEEADPRMQDNTAELLARARKEQRP